MSQQDKNPVFAKAKEITVLIDGLNPGSGFIVESRGNTHYVLTAWHVISSTDEYDIITPQGKKHRIEPENYSERVTKLPNLDIAIVEFTDEASFSVPELRIDAVTEATDVYTAGFPKNSSSLEFTDGLIVSNDLAVDTLKDGYGLIYNNSTRPGMSGGPIFDGQGRIIGIHGQAEQKQSEEGYEKAGFNLGIPIWPIREVILASVSPRLTTTNRLEMIEDFLGDFSQALRTTCESKDFKYQSHRVASPDGNTSAFLKGTVVSSNTCENDGHFSTKTAELVLETNQGGEQLNYLENSIPSSSPESLDSYSSYYAIIGTPLSFSPGGRFLIIREDALGLGTESEYGYTILDLENSNNIKSVFTCPSGPDVTSFPGDFRGFKSETEVVTTCFIGDAQAGLGDGRSAQVIFDIETESVVDVEFLPSIDSAEDLPSYGSITKSPEFSQN